MTHQPNPFGTITIDETETIDLAADPVGTGGILWIIYVLERNLLPFEQRLNLSAQYRLAAAGDRSVAFNGKVNKISHAEPQKNIPNAAVIIDVVTGLQV
jgi:hypothetical protein